MEAPNPPIADNQLEMALRTQTALPTPFPANAAIGANGGIEVAGCDLEEVARTFGTPAYVVDEAQLREQARAYLEAVRATVGERGRIAFAAKAFPATPVLAVFAEEGLCCDVASGGELELALAAGFAPERLILHGNAKSVVELRRALEVGVGLIVVDNLDELERLAALVGEQPRRYPQQILLRATPAVSGQTHAKISTGQADSKFGFALGQLPEAIDRARSIGGLELVGLHAHIGSQLLDLAPFEEAVAAVAPYGPFPVWDLGGGLGVPYLDGQAAPSIPQYVGAVGGKAKELLGGFELLYLEPGRSLTANACLTLYTVESVKRNVSLYVAVDGGMSDNLRPMLYGAPYEAHIVTRPFGSTPCVVVGKHCESGDVIVKEARLDQPRAGDLLCTPATGAYTYAMANNYNGALRPPVIFCSEGQARVVVRRERYDELLARDVR